MQIEKKLIACSILAIAIGIATIIPMQYLMTAQAQSQAEIIQAQEKANAVTNVVESVQPMFSDLNITYANCNPDNTEINDTMTLHGATILAIVNFTVAQDSLKNADAQIEYYKFAVSSDQGPIMNMGYYLALAANPYVITGMGGPEGIINFANGLTFNGQSVTGNSNIDFGCGGQGLNLDVYPAKFTWGIVSHYLFGADADSHPQAVTQLRNATTLYIDVTKICTVTVTGNVTVTLPSSDQLLQHIELSKVGNGFVYGTHANNTIPLLPVDEPSNW